MESQLHRTHGRDHDDTIHSAGLHGEERGEESRSAMKKVKEKVDKLKATIKHAGHGIHGGEHKDEAQAMNDSPVVRSGLVEPTVMGTPVLAEDLYATHSDILDPPVRSFAKWEDEERHGSPPPLSTDYRTHLTDLPHAGHHAGEDVNKDELEGGIWKPACFDEPMFTGFETHVTDQPLVGEDVNRGQLKGGIGEPIGLEDVERRGANLPTGTYGTRDVNMEQQRSIGKSSGADEGMFSTDSPANLQSDVNNPTNTGEKDVGITEVLKSFDKMKVFEEHDTGSSDANRNEPEVYTGSHDQFTPEPVENPPLDTIAANPSNPNSSYAQKISSATSAIADKAFAVKDSIVSKLSSSGEKNKTNTKSSLPTDISHKVADTLSGTLGPVYEKVAGAGSSVMSKMQGTDTLSGTLGPVYDKVAGAGSSVISKMHGTDATGSPAEKGKGGGVKEYLVESFKPGDDDKVLSEVITNAFNRGKGNQQLQETTTTTTYVVKDEGERRLQDSCN